MGKKDNILIERKDGSLWVVLPNLIGMDDNQSVEKSITEKASKSGERLVLDFTDTTIIYSSGLGLLIRLRKIITEANGEVYLVNVSKKMHETLNAMQLDKVFKIFGTDVEFIMSVGDGWKKELANSSDDFIVVNTVENDAQRLVFSGEMSALKDLSPMTEFDLENSPDTLLFNFENLEIIDTYGAQLINEFMERSHNLGKKCIFYGANEMIRELFEIFPTYTSVDFFSTEKEALDSLKKK